MSSAAIGQFESGAAAPAEDTLERLIERLGVPEEFLRLPVVIAAEGSFRSLRKTTVGARRRARATAFVAHDLAVLAGDGLLPEVTVPRHRVGAQTVPQDDIEQISHETRSVLGIGPGPVPDVVAVLERIGVVVIRLPLDGADVDAFSIPFPDRPVVVLASDKNDRVRSRFDGAHELGHLVMHGDEVWGVKEVEDQAHQFAAAFLMPRKDIERELRDKLRGGLNLAAFFDLKRRWEVSLAALLRRARDLGAITQAQYVTGMKTLSARGWRRVEPIPLGDPERPRYLAAMLDSPDGARAVACLPRHVVSAIRDATAGG